MLLDLYQVYRKMASVSPPLHHDESQTSSDSGDEAVQGEGFINGISPISSPRPKEGPGHSTPSEQVPQPSTMTLPSARAYQLEMLEESLKRNVIVAVRRAPCRAHPLKLGTAPY